MIRYTPNNNRFIGNRVWPECTNRGPTIISTVQFDLGQILLVLIKKTIDEKIAFIKY